MMNHAQTGVTRLRRSLLAVSVALFAATSCGGGPRALTAAGDTKIERVAEACGIPSRVGDEGRTISFDTRGEEEAAGDSIDTVACVLSGLEVTEFVATQIDQTTALAGVQRAEWGDFQAVWTYHPDSGLTLSVHEG